MIQTVPEPTFVQAYEQDGTTYFMKPVQSLPVAVAAAAPPPPAQQPMCAFGVPQMFYLTPVEDASMYRCVQPVPVMSTSPDFSDGTYAESSMYAPSSYAASSYAPESDMSSRASTPISVTTQASGLPSESISTRLEVLWHGHFQQLFNGFGHPWNLQPVADIKSVKTPLSHDYMDSAKVRFSCPRCGNAWTSMKGRVIFVYELLHGSCHGNVYFWLPGQKCKQCPSDAEFVHAMWYADEVEKVLSNVQQKVACTYYGLQNPQLRLDRRTGKPRQAHPPNACEACDVNICCEEHNFR